MELSMNDEVRNIKNFNDQSMIVEFSIHSEALVYTMDSIDELFLHNCYNPNTKGFHFLTSFHKLS